MDWIKSLQNICMGLLVLAAIVLFFVQKAKGDIQALTFISLALLFGTVLFVPEMAAIIVIPVCFYIYWSNYKQILSWLDDLKGAKLNL